MAHRAATLTDGWMRRPGPRSATAWLVLTALGAAPLTGPLAVTPAFAGPFEESKALNIKGAALFKKGEYFEAAQAFERAYALDARDFRVLRYAGRAWQEIGHWDRALTLLERYSALETEAELKASLLPNLEKLRKTTARERAEALATAATRYPQARLEEEAARALAALGDAASLKRAVQLLEVARLGAATPAEKDRLDTEINQARDAAQRAEAREAEARQAAAKGAAADLAKTAPAPDQGSGPTKLQWALWGGGGAVAVGGAALWLVGRGQTIEAADRLAVLPASAAAERKEARGTYDSGSTLYFAGIGLVAVGAGAALAGLFVGPGKGKVAVAPTGNGLSLALKF